MLNFKTLALSDIPTVRPFLRRQNFRINDYSIGGIFMWRDFFKTYFCVFRDTLIFKVNYLDGITAFPIPIGKDPEAALGQIENYCREKSIPLIFCTVPEESLPTLKRRYPDFSVKSDRNWSDYLYRTQDLILFRGKKYHGQRNHIHQFQRRYPNSQFEKITAENLDGVRSFYEEFARSHPMDSPVGREESAKVSELLDHYSLYGLYGGCIRVEGRFAALSVGETVGDTIFVHVEKADTRYEGIYQVLVQEFLRHFATDGTPYVNREEDVGDEGLRKSKLSYHPVALLKKNTVRAFPKENPPEHSEKGDRHDDKTL